MPYYTNELIYKNISFLIDRQFPAYYRENGAELVDLVKEYYKWMETDTKASHYNARRMFEYRDIAYTAKQMLVFFQKKYLPDLPYKEDAVDIIVRNIHDLHQRKGTSDGIELFFSLFFNENVIVEYPATKMFKPSSSNWNTGVYLQLYPNTGVFKSQSGIEYAYKDLIARNITGSVTGAKAAVDKINIVLLYKVRTPIIYIDQVQGQFEKYEQIVTNINGEVVSFGQVNGSFSEIEIDTTAGGTTGNKVGDIFPVESTTGYGGKAIVTAVSDKAEGEIIYDLAEGGWGYTLENTKLLVSNQVFFVENVNLDFIPYERITDSLGNEGIITGQSKTAIGVRSVFGDPGFVLGPTFSTLDRNPNITINVTAITALNESSPGDLFPETGDPLDVKVNELEYTETVSLIVDEVNPYLNVALNAADYEVGGAMSGTASPVNLNTALADAFDLTPFTFGKIKDFANVSEGANYVNDVFALVQDRTLSNFELHDQFLILQNAGGAGSFNIGELVTEAGTGRIGIVRRTDSQAGWILITPYTYYGFTGGDVIRANGSVFPVVTVAQDFNSNVLGENAIMKTDTRFATGKITAARIYNSGFGYKDGTEGRLINSNDEVAATGTVIAKTQGKTSGFWSDESSHLNGYWTNPDTQIFEYYDSGKKIQDSDYIQEYSYEIKSKLDPSAYLELLRKNVHLAGTKPFNQFLLRSKTGALTDYGFLRYFNDDGLGSPFDLAPVNEITADILNFAVDSDLVTADNVLDAVGSLTNGTNLNYSATWSQGTFEYSSSIRVATDGTGPRPLIILLHGAGGDGAGMITAFNGLLTDHHLVAPTGYQNSWNIVNESDAPDTIVIAELINEVKKFTNVDSSKIRIIGFSNGGALALRVGLEYMGDGLDIVCPVISQMEINQYRNDKFWKPRDEEDTGDNLDYHGYNLWYPSTTGRKFFQINGSVDATVPFGGGAAPSGATVFAADDSAYYLAKSQGFGGNKAGAYVTSGLYSNMRLYKYAIGSNTHQVVFGVNQNGGHTVPTEVKQVIQEYFDNDGNSLS